MWYFRISKMVHHHLKHRITISFFRISFVFRVDDEHRWVWIFAVKVTRNVMWLGWSGVFQLFLVSPIYIEAWRWRWDNSLAPINLRTIDNVIFEEIKRNCKTCKSSWITINFFFWIWVDWICSLFSVHVPHWIIHWLSNFFKNFHRINYESEWMIGYNERHDRRRKYSIVDIGVRVNVT